MTTEQKTKAALFLLNNDDPILPGDLYHLPLTFMVGDEVCITFYSALRYQMQRFVLDQETIPIELMTIEEAYSIKHQKPMPKSVENTIDRHFDTKGNHRQAEHFYEWQFRLIQADPVLADYYRKHSIFNPKTLFSL